MQCKQSTKALAESRAEQLQSLKSRRAKMLLNSISRLGDYKRIGSGSSGIVQVTSAPQRSQEKLGANWPTRTTKTQLCACPSGSTQLDADTIAV